MHIVDVLAIMPYYVSLFLLNDPIITPPEDGILLSAGSSDLEDDGSSVEGILQVFTRHCSTLLRRVLKCVFLIRCSEYSSSLESSSWAATPPASSP